MFPKERDSLQYTILAKKRNYWLEGSCFLASIKGGSDSVIFLFQLFFYSKWPKNGLVLDKYLFFQLLGVMGGRVWRPINREFNFVNPSLNIMLHRYWQINFRRQTLWNWKLFTAYGWHVDTFRGISLVLIGSGILQQVIPFSMPPCQNVVFFNYWSS